MLKTVIRPLYNVNAARVPIAAGARPANGAARDNEVIPS